MGLSILAPVSVPPRAAVLGGAEGWKGPQGLAWAERNPPTVEALDANYLKRFGVSRTAVNAEFLEGVDRDARVLEVGCSAGRQLDVLASMGFTDLYGVDLSEEALRMCRWPHEVADAASLPFADGSFDLVMVSGTLMHVPPDRKETAFRELTRVSSRWIYGCEMWTEQYTRWDFGDLMPNAWTCDWSRLLDVPEWPIVKRRMLSGSGTPLDVFLMERGS